MYSTGWTSVSDCPFDGFAWRADAEPDELDDTGTLIFDYEDEKVAVEGISLGWHATLQAASKHCPVEAITALQGATDFEEDYVSSIAERTETRLGRENLATPTARLVTVARSYGGEFPYGRQAVAGGALALIDREQRNARGHNALTRMIGEVNASGDSVRNVYDTIESVVPPRLITVIAQRDTIPDGSATARISAAGALED